MEELLSIRSKLDFAFLARKVAEGERRPEEFFKHWPDISSKEERDIRDLWFHVQYFENDIVHDPDGAEYFREAIFETAGRIEERYRVKWDPAERGEPRRFNPEGSVERSRHRTLDEQARHE